MLECPKCNKKTWMPILAAAETDTYNEHASLIECKCSECGFVDFAYMEHPALGLFECNGNTDIEEQDQHLREIVRGD